MALSSESPLRSPLRTARKLRAFAQGFKLNHIQFNSPRAGLHGDEPDAAEHAHILQTARRALLPPDQLSTLLPDTISSIPVALLESTVWSVFTYYVIGAWHSHLHAVLQSRKLGRPPLPRQTHTHTYLRPPSRTRHAGGRASSCAARPAALLLGARPAVP
jgi:hypothetical protein